MQLVNDKYLLPITFSILLSAFYSQSSVAGEDTIVFSWPTPSQATVEEFIKKPNTNLKVKYIIHFDHTPDKQAFILSQSDFEVIEIKGKKVPESQRTTHPFIDGIFPPIMIALDGKPMDVVNFDEYMENIISRIKHDEILKIARFKPAQMVVYSRAFENWCYWVCNWLDARIQKDKPLEEVIDEDLFGISLPAKWVTTYHGKTGPISPFIRLSATVTIEGPEATDRLIQNMEKVWQFFPPRKQTDSTATVLTIDDFQKKYIVESTLDPKGLKPLEVVYKSNLFVRINEETVKKIEERVYKFHWVNN